MNGVVRLVGWWFGAGGVVTIGKIVGAAICGNGKLVYINYAIDLNEFDLLSV